VNTLKRQKEAAEQYESLLTRLNELEMWRLLDQHQQLTAQVEQHRKRAVELRTMLEGARVNEQAEKNKVEVLSLKKQEADITYRDGVQQYVGLEKGVSSQESVIKIAENEIRHEEETAERTKKELGELAERKKRKELLVDQSREKSEHLKAVVKIKKEELTLLEIRYTTVKNDKLEGEGKLNEIKKKLFTFEKEKAQIEAQEASSQLRLKSVEEGIAQCRAREVELGEELTAAVTSRDTCLADQGGLKEKIAALNTEISATDEKIAALSREREVLLGQHLGIKERVSRLSGELGYVREMIARREDLSEGNKRFLEALEKKNLLVETAGIMVERLKPHDDWRIAGEALFTGMLGYVLTADREMALRLIDMAKTLKVSTGLCITKEGFTPRGTVPLEDAVPARECFEELDPQLEVLLDGWYFTPDLPAALALAETLPLHGGCVTSDGIVVSARGPVLVPGKKAASGFAFRKKLELLEGENATLKKEDDAMASKIRGIEEADQGVKKERNLHTSARAELEKALSQANEAWNKAETSVKVLGNSRQLNGERLSQLLKELDTLKGASGSKGLKTLNEHISTLQTTLWQTEDRLTLHNEAFLNVHEELGDLKVAVQTWETKLLAEDAQVERLRSEIREVDDQSRLITEARGHSAERIKVLNEQLVTARERGKVLAVELAGHKKIHDELGKQLSLISEELEKQKQVLREKSDAAARIGSELGSLKLELSRLEGNRGYVEREYEEKFGVGVASGSSLLEELGSFSREAETERLRLRDRANVQKSDYNPAAIREYNEVFEKHAYLVEQKSDLVVAVKNLEKAIALITQTTRKRFLAAFNDISDKFSKLFPTLFNGGSASLVLEEGDPLEAGVEIIAQPPGKKLQSMELLSGGEKAMTAIALIFSMFLYSPSPFCILDEVDAPLDEANVEKYNELLRKMSERTQFIIVTHNRLTMEAADRLYGVTMEERGVSRAISLDVEQLEDFG
ncbi:hypothetical protein KJ865_03505, partial [Myxococcota bacterium]|nr:hypothetical protein [Myxococcota bacterium]